MNKKKLIRNLFFVPLLALSGLLFFVSCEDPYEENDKDPDWLGDSIYDMLENYENKEDIDRSFNYFIQLVKSVSESTGADYVDVLKKTGSKTVFVADDKAFEAFFADNEYGIKRFEDFSDAQRRSLLFANMLDDAYLLEMLSKYPGTPPAQGQTMRKTTAWAVMDSVPYVTRSEMPDNNKYWNRFQDRGIYLLKDYSRWTMVYFSDYFLQSNSITQNDFKVITGQDWSNGGTYIFDNKVIVGDLTCKNGYVNIMEKLVLPADNMAEYIRQNDNVKTFSRFMERFSAPYYSTAATAEYRELYPHSGDSIFVKRYFNDHGTGASTLQDPLGVTVDGLLSFDAGWNSFQTNVSSARTAETDMGAMFVPSDAALDEYFNGGEGAFIKERYGAWDNVPNNVLNLLVNNHMRPSFVASVPSKFSAMEDKTGNAMGIQAEDIDYAYVCSNGVVYVMNKVFPPTEYASVMSPVIFSAETKVFNWAQGSQGLQFDLYLLSMENKYSYLVPTDAVLTNYINPVSIGKGEPERLSFFYNESTQLVNAIAYDYETGDSLRLISTQSLITAYLQDILDNHIIVGDIEDGKRYYSTKGGATVKIEDGVKGVGMGVSGGGNMEYGEDIRVEREYDMLNGKTYFMTGTVQTPLQSVLNVMESHPEYSEFYELCVGAFPVEGFDGKTYGGNIFANDKSYIGLSMNVSFFNTYNYTVYIPTNDAVRKAINDRVIKTWEEIDEMEDIDEKTAEAEKLYQFLRYHFQDNSVYISGETVNHEYQTASRNAENKFRKLKLSGNGSNLTVTTESGASANVITTDPSLYNVMARDYKFNAATITAAATISTSSYAVIHLIDSVLRVE